MVLNDHVTMINQSAYVYMGAAMLHKLSQYKWETTDLEL